MIRPLPALGLVLAVLAPAACSMPAPETAAAASPRVVGFATVAEARVALGARADLKAVTTGGYDLLSDEANGVLWVFTRPGHAAYPAVIRREWVAVGPGVLPRSTMLCQADPAACALLAENARLMDALIVAQTNRPPSPQRPARARPPPMPPIEPAPPAVRI